MNRNQFCRRTLSFFGWMVLLLGIFAGNFALPVALASEENLLIPPSETKPKTGVFRMGGESSESWLVVPAEWNSNRTYPLIISLAPAGTNLEEHAKSWANLSERRAFIVLVPEMTIRSGEAAHEQDRWILQLLDVVSVSYPLSQWKVFVIGFEDQASYAAHLAFSNPDRFSALALLGRGWQGPYERQTRLHSRAKNQVPVVVALRGEQELKTQLEFSAQELQSKGYLVNIETYPEKEDFASREAREKIYNWLMEKSSLWQDELAKTGTTWKEKFRTFWEENFFIR